MNARALDEVYKGYKISCAHGREWVAHIWAPGNAMELAPCPTASEKEGSIVLLQRAHAMIDRHLAAK